MIPVLVSNDPVDLSYGRSLLEDAGIACFLWDQHVSAVEGSLGILPRRLVVTDEDAAPARRILTAAGLEPVPADARR